MGVSAGVLNEPSRTDGFAVAGPPARFFLLFSCPDPIGEIHPLVGTPRSGWFHADGLNLMLATLARRTV